MKQALRLLIIIFLVIGEIHCVAQKPVQPSGQAHPLAGQALLDSLLKDLPKQKEDTGKVALLYALSLYYSNVDLDEGIKYGRQELELATKINWKRGIADANKMLGLYGYLKSDYTKAIEYYQKALNQYEEIGFKKGVAAVTCNIGNVYNKLSNYPKTLEYYLRALKLDEEGGFKQYEAFVTGNIGDVYQYESDFPKALEYYFRALKMDEEIGDKNVIARIIECIGVVCYNKSDYPKALEYHFKALKLYEEMGDKDGIAVSYTNIGGVYQAQKNYTQAVEYEQRALKIGEEHGDKYIMAGNLGSIGKLYISIIRDTVAKTGIIPKGSSRKGSFSNVVAGPDEFSVNKYQPTISIPTGKAALLAHAIDYTQRSLIICKEIKALELMQDDYETLSDAYKLKGDYKKAMEYADDEKVIKDSVFSAENNKKIIQQSMKYEYQKREDSLKLENAKMEKAAALKFQQQRNYTYVGIAGILALTAFSFFIIKERRKSDRLLLNILPSEIAYELKNKGATTARHYDNVTVLFTDFANFTEAGERMSPQTLIDELHTCFKAFDDITTKYNVEKIKTIGDAYLAVTGLPTADPLHAEHAVRAAMEINAFMRDRYAKLGNSTFEIRIGIHSGSVVAGIVGVKKFAYDIWGDTVNTAARMEQNSAPGKVNISEATYKLVKDKFTCEYRGEIEAKGKGEIKMYFASSAIAFSA